MTDQTALKRAAAARAMDFVRDGMKLGLGSGSTAEIFVESLATRVQDRHGVKALAAQLGPELRDDLGMMNH